MIEEKTIDNVNVGDKACFTKTITETDIVLFAGLTGDFAPHHVDAEFAKTTMFGERIAHGMLIASLTCAVTTKLVSPGALAISQEVKFKLPVKIGDTITAIGEVVEKIYEKKIVKIRTYCLNQRGEMVIDGLAVELMRVR